MERKVFLSVLVIILILALSGCGMVPPGIPEWMRAEQEVYSYWKAIINRQYELAKWHCVYDGLWYNKTDEWEEYINVNSEGETSVVVSFSKFYEQTEVIGDIIVVYAQIFVDKIPFLGSCVINVDTFYYEIGLIKQDYPPGDWILK